MLVYQRVIGLSLLIPLITRLGFVGSSPPSRELNNLSRTVEQEMGLHRSKVVGQLDPMDILFDFLANLTILAG